MKMTKEQYAKNLRFYAIDNIKLDLQVFWRFYDRKEIDMCERILRSVREKLELLRGMVMLFSDGQIDYLEETIAFCTDSIIFPYATAKDDVLKLRNACLALTQWLENEEKAS